MLGPLLFLLYINDLPGENSSTIRLYTDDVIIYRQINFNNDILKLQEDLAEWAKDWLLVFNLTKCEHLTITNKQSSISSNYTINNCLINKVTSSMYLGITITYNLS